MALLGLALLALARCMYASWFDGEKLPLFFFFSFFYLVLLILTIFYCHAELDFLIFHEPIEPSR